MSLLQWKPEYSVGIESMDVEHRELISMINGIYEKLRLASDAVEIEDGLEKIFTSISLHFALEERIMQEQGYGEFTAHKEDHEELLDEIRELMDEFVADPDNGARLLEQRLSDWFARHFSTFDARLHDKFGAH